MRLTSPVLALPVCIRPSDGHHLLFGYSMRSLLAVGCVVLGLAGCSSGPAAPELGDSPVYYNRLEGLRFLVPDGWTQTASANLPPGDFEGEHFLVRYSVRSPEPNAQAQVLCRQVEAGVDVEKLHALPAFGIEHWKLEEASEAEKIGGAEGTWLYYTGAAGDQLMGKQVLCFRRSGRLYSFVGMFRASDEKARQAIRRAFKSVVWDS